MKKFFSALLAALMLLSCASCGAPDSSTEPVDTEPTVTDVPETAAPETNVPETNAPETNAPETAAPETQEIPNDPTFDPDEKDDGGDTKMIFEYDFAAGENKVDGFSVIAENFNLAAGEGYKTTADNGLLRIKDNDISLKGKSIMVEGDITFDVLPHKADGVTNFPLSIISWIRTDLSGNTTYDWIFKMDDNGTFYIKDGTTPTTTKPNSRE